MHRLELPPGTKVEIDFEGCARSWLGTPFFPHGYVKGPGGGVSCQTLVTCIYSEAGVLPAGFRVPEGPLDWARAQHESLIEAFVDKHLADYLTPLNGKGEPVNNQPITGDLLGFRVGGCVHHLGICIGVEFVHCLKKLGTIASRVDDATWLSRIERIWRPNGRKL
jgi:hypothetical protein